MTKPVQSRRFRKPTYPGCKQVVTGHGHTKGIPWECRHCKKQACSGCVHYFWSAKAGAPHPQSGGTWVFVGERIATCPSCAGKVPFVPKSKGTPFPADDPRMQDLYDDSPQDESDV